MGVFDIFKKKARKAPIKQRVEHAASNGDKRVDFDYDETTAVIDLTLERCRTHAEDARKKMDSASEALRDITAESSTG